MSTWKKWHLTLLWCLDCSMSEKPKDLVPDKLTSWSYLIRYMFTTAFNTSSELPTMAILIYRTLHTRGHLVAMLQLLPWPTHSWFQDSNVHSSAVDMLKPSKALGVYYLLCATRHQWQNSPLYLVGEAERKSWGINLPGCNYDHLWPVLWSWLHHISPTFYQLQSYLMLSTHPCHWGFSCSIHMRSSSPNYCLTVVRLIQS